MNWLFGKIKFFDSERGFGFVKEMDSENDFFIHHSKLKSETIYDNDYVVFKLKDSTKKKGTMEAFNMYLISDFIKDTDFLLKIYLEHDLSKFKGSILKNLNWKGIKTILSKEIQEYSNIDNETKYWQFKSWVKNNKSLNLIEEQSQLTDRYISIWALKNTTNAYKIKLWLKNVILSAPETKTILDFFIKTDNTHRLETFSKVDVNIKYLLLDELLEQEEYHSTFSFIKDYIKETNNISEYIDYNDIHNNTFKEDGLEFFNYITTYYEENLNEEEKLKLFLRGYLKTFSREYVINSFVNFSESTIEEILVKEILTPEETFLVFEKLLINTSGRVKKLDYKPFEDIIPNQNTYDLNLLFDHIFYNKPNYIKTPLLEYYWVFELAKKHLDSGNFKLFIKSIHKSLPSWGVLALWEDKIIDNISKKILKEILIDNSLITSKVCKWISEKLKSEDEINSLILELLKSLIITSRKDLFLFKSYMSVLNNLQFKESLDQFLPENHLPFLNVLNWLEGKSEAFDFDQYKKLIVCFPTTDQIQFIRKLFWLKQTGKFDLTIEKLEQITRVDLDIYKINKNYNPDVYLDISIHVVIEALKSFENNQKFLLESELLKLVLDNYHQNKYRSFKILNLFDKCDGRSVPKYNFENLGGTIRKINHEGRGYFSIAFPTGENVLVQTRSSSYYKFVHNPYFDAILEDVKKLPTRQWYPDAQVWGVPDSLENQVMELAKKHRFFLNFDGNKFNNNPHLAEFKRKTIPSGISFCEGRLSNTDHNTHKTKFWWCCNQACFDSCVNTPINDKWENYTFLDFCSILGFNLDDSNNIDSSIENSKYYQFINVINRFNRLLKRLYCSECDEMLYPKEEAHFAHYRVVLFNCINSNCSKCAEPVYLHHCLNAKCNGIIDSRVSKQCPNGLYVCSNKECGCCCSHKMFKTRFNNLTINNAFIHNDLSFKIENKLGHLERAEHYCYECSNKMNEIDKDIFECKPCNITYNLVSNYFDRPHKGLVNNTL